MEKSKKIGLALGAGGARGLAHIGVLKVLEREGIKPDYIAGASMGSLIGAMYASGFSVAEIEEIALGMSKAKMMRDVFDFGKPGKSILGIKKIIQFLKKYLDSKTFHDTKIPLRIMATRLENGEEVALHKGELVTAILASISVPGIFPPIKIDNKYYVDGGVVNPTPIDVVKNMGANFTIGVDLIMKRKLEVKDPNIFTTLMQSYEIIRTQAVKAKLEKATSNTVLIKPEIRGTIDSFKFYDINKFIKSGEEAALKEIKKINKKIK